MLILPPGHAQAVRAKWSPSRREKWILGSLLAAVAAVIVAVVISIGTAERQTVNGCVDVKFPTTIGGAEIYRCGASARALCAGEGTKGSSTTGVGTIAADRAVAAQCRKARLPVG